MLRAEGQSRRSFWVGGECAGGVDEVLEDLRMCWEQEEVLGEWWRSSEEHSSVEECFVEEFPVELCSMEK